MKYQKMFPPNTKHQPKYVRKMFLWAFICFVSTGDLVTRTGEREIQSVSGRLPADNPGELA